MDARDQRLGMDRAISRRDFLNGVSVVVGASLLPACGETGEPIVAGPSGDVAWWPEAWQHERRPWVDARQRVGNIAFAGTDAASNAMTESAIEEAHRAVHSLGTEAARQAT